jgi:hypothetical protein
VFWLENNQLKEVVKKKKSGGKGGGASSTVKTYTYFATFAVGLCEGPIAGVRRIWVGPDLIYDAGSDDLETIISSNNAASGFSVYLGTEDQQPDPRIQAEMGVANCPAYRGLAYIVMKDLALANYGNSVAGAQIKVEIAGIATISPYLISQNSYTESGITDVIIGNSSDSASRSNYVIYRDSSYPTLVRLSQSGQSIERALPAPAPYASAIKGIHSVLNKINYVYGEIQGPFYRVFWGNESVFYSAAHSASFSYFRQFIEASEDLIFLLVSTDSVSPIYLERVSVTQGSTSVLIGEDVNGFIRNGEVVLFTISAPTVTFKTYNIDDLSLTGTFSTSVTGMDASFNSSVLRKITFKNEILSVITTASGDKLLRLNLSTLDGVVTTIPKVIKPTNNNDDQNLSDLGGVIKVSNASIYPSVFMTSSVAISRQTDSSVSLADIFDAEAGRSNLIAPADIDSSGLTDSVTGFKVTATGSIRNAIEPLRGAWPFDVVQSGYQIKARTRGSASVVTIPVGELAIDTQLTESREMDSQLPQNVTIKYLDRDRDYDVNEQRAQRDNTEAVNSLGIDLPVVLSASQAAQVADKLIRIYALEKSDFVFTLPAPYRYLEPGDVITIETDDAQYILRLSSVNHTADGRLECTGRPSSASTYVSIAPGDPGQGGQVTIPLAGATVGSLIDAPIIDESLQDIPGFVCSFNGYSSGWPGGVLFQTADNGQTWVDLQAIQGQSTSGSAANSLSVNAGNLIQRGGSLTVWLTSGNLEGITESQMLNGANYAAYGMPGRWEIIRFQNATLNANGSYTIDTFWRGDRGTEWATGLHVIGDQFVLMDDPDLAFVGMPADSIGAPRNYRAVTAGASIDTAESQPFTYLAVNLETYSGVHPVGTRAANDLTITWQRRTRVGGAWRDFVDASLGETSEAYEVDIMQGATVKRTLTATTPSVLYTSAMQVTDFGSVQSSVTVKIYQMSSVVGRGYPLEATL